MLTEKNLKMLADVSGPCLTIYQPLRDDYSQVAKSDTRITAALQQAGRLLEEKGFNAVEREEMLQPLIKAVSNTDWTDRKGAVLMFRGPSLTMVSFWPDALAARVHFADEFLVLPLLPGFLSNRDFWLLALSLKSVRLFRGSRAGLSEVKLPKGVPTGLSEDEAFDQPDHSLRSRASAGPSVGNMKGVQFGTSTAKELKADYLHDFFKAIDRGIQPILAADRQPLILAGVTRELAIYRSANTYSPLLTGAIHGSPEGFSADLLHSKATELMLAYSALAMDATLREIEEAANRGLAITDPAAIIDAARNGQVEELIVAPDIAQRAIDQQAIDQHQEAVNWAALATIRNSGSIKMLNAPQMTTGITAILRFRSTEPSGKNVELPQGT